jgi:hypothetical protein
VNRSKRLLFGNEAILKPYLAALFAVIIAIAAIEVYVIVQILPNSPTSSRSPSFSPTASAFQTAMPTITPTPTTITPNFTLAPSTSSTVAPTPIASPMPSVTRARNWAGYMVSSDLQTPQPNVTGVSGSWIVPSVMGSANSSYSAVWIGIGGQFDRTLIQCGTEQDFVGGQIIYSAWYELLPGRSFPVRSMDVSPGDQIQASIQALDATLGQWSINIKDVTTGASFQRTFSYASSQLSAEWIIERPTVNGVLSSLADFGKVTITDCHASFGNVSGGITSFPALKTIMYSSLGTGPDAVQLTDVSSLDSNGTSFTVSFLTIGQGKMS